MALVKVTITVCDVCEQAEGVRQYDLKQGDRKVKTDLCTEHQQVIEGLFKQVEKQRGAAKPRGRRKSTRVTTIEEIEASKSG